ncbi:imm11 family protein [Pleionea sp. CnH1-48]|uniref:imm11 family protein n=1 Tax=Pleionea sp. CnH1-48 TaxID=2954494 RepID=UPI002096D428|nr:DUF1629 domain-containing protein [Pleionea sp. CnH1-48]MCO7223646.1 hypothetical protein [Pleionea sp. CnH1-48]
MRFFQIEILGDLKNIKQLPTIERAPSGLKLKCWHLTEGLPVKNLYEKVYSGNLKVYLENMPQEKGMTDFISNTACLLVVSSRCKELFDSHLSEQEVEILPLDIYSSDEQIVSSDYWMVHSLATFDALDTARSEVIYDECEPYDPIGVDGDYVFSEDKVSAAPALFRIPEYPSDFFIREDLARALHSLEPSNLFLTEIQVA